MIHKYKLNGYNIVMDINSGAVHVTDDVTYDLVGEDGGKSMPDMEAQCKKYADKYTKEEMAEAAAEIKSLTDAGALFSEDYYADFADKAISSPIKSMCLHIAHDCNLVCDYCFAAKGDFGHGRCLMSAETGKRAIDFLIEKSANRHNLEVDFFGGEPLMNFDVVKEIVEYARSLEKKHNKNFRFTITTNGVLLSDDIIDYINGEMSNIVLSIDGRPEVNDRFRKTANGKGSYDVIIDKYKKLVSKRTGDYYVRGTFTRKNLDFSEDVLHLWRSGFDQISVEPVVASPELDYSLREEDIPAICAEYEKLANIIIDMKSNGEKINFFHFNIDLDGGPCIIKRLKGCGCGNEYVAITPEGDIYPCHQFVGMEEWKMGSLYDGSFDNDKKQLFAANHVLSKDKCSDCWAKFYCSGGCSANNVQYMGDIHKPHEISCALEKKRVECAVMIKAALA